MMYKLKLALCIMTLILVSTAHVYASGSRPRKPPRPPGVGVDDGVDKRQYSLGKKVYRGRGVGTAVDQALATSQRTLLDALQKKLEAKKIRSKVNTLAGRIDDKQLQALRYFIKTRYNIK